MIVAISGRKQSGKSLASNILVDSGYLRYSFATFLKSALAETLELPLNTFYDEKIKEVAFAEPILWDKRKATILAVLAEEDIPHYGDKELYSAREAMEHVGTHVLRRFDPAFHVKKTAKVIAEYDGDVVVDDMRFPNELEALKNIGARALFVMRPFHMEYSNSVIESSVNWTMPEYNSVIVNSGTKDEFFKNLKLAIEGHSGILGATSSISDILFTSKDQRTAEEAGYLAETGVTQDGILSETFIATFSSIFSESKDKIKRNPFIIENLKMWNSVGDTSNRGIPYQIADDALLSTAFRLGVVTGKYDKLRVESKKVLDKTSIVG